MVRLTALRIVHLPPFEDLLVPFFDDQGNPRSITVIYGGGGVGKTTILNALALTRPGHTIALPTVSDSPPYVICDWTLGTDDTERPHPLRVATPMARTDGDELREAFRRKEQALFDKLARQGGFAFLALSSTRWFSRQPIGFSAPERTIARYDVRAVTALDDASRSDLARETKQALAYADVTAALGRRSATEWDFGLLSDAMHVAVNALVGLAGFRYEGLETASLEPIFRNDEGELVHFDALPTRARHLVAFAALTIRMLWGAYPGKNPLTEAEGVVAIDEVDLHQGTAIQSVLVSALRTALPRVQWILTTTSPVVATSCEDGEVFALRRLPHTAAVELFSGLEARVH